MRILLIILSCLVVINVSAQFGVYLKGRSNTTNVRVIETSFDHDEYTAKWGWQVESRLEFITEENIILFSGLGITSNKYVEHLLSYADAAIKNNFQFTFLNIPVGFGYHFQPIKNISLNFYGGAYYYIGIGGTVFQEFESYEPDYSAGEALRKVKYGNAYDDDLRKTNWGLQTGFSIGVLKNLQVELNYQHGMTNILPKEEDNYEKQKFRIFSMGLKYNVLCNCK